MKTFKQIKEDIKQVSVSKEHEDTLNGQKDPTSSGLKIKTDATDAQKSNTLKSRKPASPLTVKPTNEDASVMSVGGGAVSPIAPVDASAVYSLQRDKLKKKVDTKLVKRKRPIDGMNDM